jgi:hypothetical protein
MPVVEDVHGNWLTDSYTSVIDSLELEDLHKVFLKARWLDQLMWLEARAVANRRAYYRLRIATIVGGATLTALAGLRVSGAAQSSVNWAIFALGLMTTIAAGLEEFFQYGATWRAYREKAERLKTEGWHFFQLTGPYGGLNIHAEAFRAFAARVEETLSGEGGGVRPERLQEQPKKT